MHADKQRQDNTIRRMVMMEMSRSCPMVMFSEYKDPAEQANMRKHKKFVKKQMNLIIMRQYDASPSVLAIGLGIILLLVIDISCLVLLVCTGSLSFISLRSILVIQCVPCFALLAYSFRCPVEVSALFVCSFIGGGVGEGFALADIH